MPAIRTAQHALNSLRKARDLDNLSWRQWTAYLKNGASTNERRSTANADKAALLFLEVEMYLSRLI